MASIYSSTAPTLTGSTYADTGPISFSAEVKSTAGASLTAVRYYVANTQIATDQPTATAYVWDNASHATPVATKAFAPQASIGWQTITLDTPIAMAAGANYQIVVDFPGSTAVHYGAKTSETWPVTNGDLTLVFGAYRAGASHLDWPGVDPTGFTTNYYVDIVTAGGSSVTLTATSGHVATVGEAVPVSATPAGGTGTKTYAWTSNAGGAFAAPTSASTTWTAATAGTATLTCTVTDTVSGTASATTTVVVVAASPAQTVTTTGTITLVGGAASATAALTDTDPATGIDCANTATVTDTFGVVYKPTTGGLPITVTGSITGGATTASFAVQLQGNVAGTWTNIGTAQTATLTATDTAVTVTVPQAALDAASASVWGTANLVRAVLTATAA